MNSIKHSVNGLASSLFLAAGLTRLAEKTDPLFKQGGTAITTVASAQSCDLCAMPCNFTAQIGQ